MREAVPAPAQICRLTHGYPPRIPLARATVQISAHEVNNFCLLNQVTLRVKVASRARRTRTARHGAAGFATVPPKDSVV